MLNVKSMLDRYNIRYTNKVFAVADISERVMGAVDPCYMATKIFNDLLNIPVPFKDPVHARTAAKHMVRDIITCNCQLDEEDIADIIEAAIEYADQFCADSTNSYLWAQPDETKVDIPTIQLIEGIDVKVAIREDGKIKKGGKQVLAAELYDKFIKLAIEPLSNQLFIQLLIDKLDMTKQGATTYAYNLRKANKELA